MRLVALFFLLFTVTSTVEIGLFMVITDEIGIPSTLAMILFTGIAGASLARSQGFAVLRQTQEALAQGRMPTDELVEGAIVLFGGALLLTPGFLTDVFGLSCLLPLSRKGYAFVLRRWAAGKITRVGPGRANAGGFRMWTGGVHPGPGARSGGRPSPGPAQGFPPSGGYEPPPSTTGSTATIDATFSVLDDEDQGGEADGA